MHLLWSKGMFIKYVWILVDVPIKISPCQLKYCRWSGDREWRWWWLWWWLQKILNGWSKEWIILKYKLSWYDLEICLHNYPHESVFYCHLVDTKNQNSVVSRMAFFFYCWSKMYGRDFQFYSEIIWDIFSTLLSGISTPRSPVPYSYVETVWLQ